MLETAIKPTALPGSVSTAAVKHLRETLPGRVFLPEDAGYDPARSGFSLTDLPSPDVVVMAEHAEDVVAAVDFARAHDLPIRVHGTGHNFAFANQGGVMINTSRMNTVTVDPLTQTVRVAGGAKWKHVMPKVQTYGLAPLSGSSPEVGVVGYSLFGGIGWLVRKYGAAVDSIVAAEVVTADGQLRRVDAQHEAELFWALRGGGGNFGVVTALELKLYPVSTVYGGNLFFPITQAKKVLTAYRAWVDTLPDELTSAVVLLRLPPLPHLPPSLSGQHVVSIRACFLGTQTEGEALLAPLRALDGIIADTFRVLPYAETSEITNDPVQPVHALRKSMMLQTLNDDTIDTVLQLAGEGTPSSLKVIEVRHLGGALARSQEATAFSQRTAPFALQAIGGYTTPQQAEDLRHDLAELAEALEPYGTGGVLPGWLGDGDHGVARTRAGYLPERWDRLVILKKKYDPANRFSLMHNIPPSDAAQVSR